MFCKNCETKVSDGAKFCTSCGAMIDTPTAAPQLAAAGRPAKKNRKNTLMIAIAIILMLMGTGYMGLAAVGKPVTAQVTGYEQVLILNNDDSTRTPSRYKLEYQFSVNGERYDGSVTRLFEGGSHIRKTISVRYLPFWPHISAEDGGAVGFAGPAALGLGILVLVLTVREKRRR